MPITLPDRTDDGGATSNGRVNAEFLNTLKAAHNALEAAVEALGGQVEDKAEDSAVAALAAAVAAQAATIGGKAEGTALDALAGTVAAQATTIGGKAEADDVHPAATAAEARAAIDEERPLTPGVLAEISQAVDMGSVSGNVAIDVTAGPILRYRIGGATHFTPGELRHGSGLIKIRMLGSYAVTFDSAIVRDISDPTLAPDGRPWVETVYAWSVTDGRLELQVVRVSYLTGPAVPSLTAFGGCFDPASGGLRVGNSGSAISDLGSAVKYYPPAGFAADYIGAAGTALTLAAANQVYASADTDELPTLVERAGRRGVQFSAAGDGLIGSHFGVVGVGVPNPIGTPAAMPFARQITMGAMVFTPADLSAACPVMTMHRTENSNTGRWGIWLTAAGAPYVYTRLDSASPRQAGTIAEVAADSAVHPSESSDAVRGTWRMIIAQLEITSIDTAADTTPPGATVRGTGATLRLWVDGDLALSEEVDISSFRGSNGLAWQFNRTVLGAAYSSTARQAGSPVTIGRCFFGLEPLAYGDPKWWEITSWLGGV